MDVSSPGEISNGKVVERSEKENNKLRAQKPNYNNEEQLCDVTKDDYINLVLWELKFYSMLPS